MRSSPDGFDGSRLPPAEAFSILGNELRLTILQVLWEADDPLTFAELRDRVGRDDSGNFNYHLGRLVDDFVRKSAEGYELRYAGAEVVRSIVAGTITEDTSLPPTPIDDYCPYCDAPVEVRYDEEVLTVSCTECSGVVGGEFPDGTYMSYGFPPGGLTGRSLEEVVTAAHILYDSKIHAMMSGVCPECAGTVEVTVDVCDDHDEDGFCGRCGTRYSVWSEYVCETCRYRRKSAVWFEALNHPAVVSFLHEFAGLEETVPFRKLTSDHAGIVRNITEEIRSTDPYRFRIRIVADDRTLLVDLDEELDVRTVSRE